VSQVNESRLETQVGTRHQDGRPYHFSALNQEDRIRRVFGVPDDAPLPSVSDQTLAVYYDHLVAALSLPFDALYCPTGGDVRQLIHYVRVTDLLDPRQGHLRNLHGLFCKVHNTKEVLHLSLADLGVRDDNPNCQTLDDYAYWFVNWR
jgi:hypothetical protein